MRTPASQIDISGSVRSGIRISGRVNSAAGAGAGLRVTGAMGGAGAAGAAAGASPNETSRNSGETGATVATGALTVGACRLASDTGASSCFRSEATIVSPGINAASGRTSAARKAAALRP